ncbi:MAG: hypothetical protein HOK71_22640 [Planctomycetaceae bacterium]|nr:hypothetical protein [Planctomycetaceae bacterium]MBT6487458.1 hypothetical protein [Planctomycetaceae bacterium]
MPLIIAIVITSFAGISANAYCDPPRKEAREAAKRKSGRNDVFSIVGSIDFDNDGISDRQLLHKHLAATGSTIIDEVDDSGVRRPANGKITPKTTMLVLGELIDPATVTDLKEREVAKRIVRHFHAMRAEAREAGVRTAALMDFVSYSPRSHRARHPWLYGDLPSKASGIFSRRARLYRPGDAVPPSKVFRGAGSRDDRQ